MRRWAGLAGYFAGSVGANFAMWPISSLLLYFLTETAAFSVALATAVITIPKVWDVFVDPMIAAWADRSSVRRGHRGGMLMLSAIALPVAMAAVFFLPSPAPTWMAALVVVALIASSSAFMVFLISHVALADDMEQAGAARRDSVLAVRVAGQAAGSLSAGAAGPILITILGGAAAAYSGMASLLAAAAVIGLVVVALTARHFPTRRREGESESSGGLIQALRAVLHNRTAGLLILSNFFIYIGSAVITTFMPYLNKHLLGEPDSSMSILYSCIMVGMVAGSALAAIATRHLPRATALLAASALMTIAAAFFLPACASGARNLASGILLLWGLGMGMYSLLIFSATMDAAAPAPTSGGTSGSTTSVGAGLLLGLLISTGKIGDSLGGALTGALLSWSGYVPNAASAGHVLNSLRSSYTAVALVTMGLSLVSLLPLLRRRSLPQSSASTGERAA